MHVRQKHFVDNNDRGLRADRVDAFAQCIVLCSVRYAILYKNTGNEICGCVAQREEVFALYIIICKSLVLLISAR